ncbi:GntR family transcriptional regulator [Micromonospora mirobrigensis]|uniref:Regulatory protein, gntR family n=1 Tax=Micromonospora mirobrigensis TaxID=262898 RepID=A0A1C5ANG2_9ACTN|nr:GntR family transcriptional regulator [Micromonospora mirobrigensis]SCF46775.1 regulatory protein, gntR family [Micromonospora mirobrigensis]
MPTRPPHCCRVADDIEAKIRSGDHAPGQQLPPVSEIGELDNVARSIAYRAVKELHERNLVYGQPALAKRG